MKPFEIGALLIGGIFVVGILTYLLVIQPAQITAQLQSAQGVVGVPAGSQGVLSQSTGGTAPVTGTTVVCNPQFAPQLSLTGSQLGDEGVAVGNVAEIGYINGRRTADGQYSSTPAVVDAGSTYDFLVNATNYWNTTVSGQLLCVQYPIINVKMGRRGGATATLWNKVGAANYSANTAGQCFAATTGGTANFELVIQENGTAQHWYFTNPYIKKYGVFITANQTGTYDTSLSTLSGCHTPSSTENDGYNGYFPSQGYTLSFICDDGLSIYNSGAVTHILNLRIAAGRTASSINTTGTMYIIPMEFFKTKEGKWGFGTADDYNLQIHRFGNQVGINWCP